MGSILFAGALLAGGTGALVSQTQNSTGNTFTSGIVNFKIDNESYVTSNAGKLVLSTTTTFGLSDLAGKLFFNFGDVKPGDIGEDTISLHNLGNDAWMCMKVKLTGTAENGQPEPETLVDSTTGVNQGELQNALQFAFWADDGDNVYEKGEKIFQQGNAATLFDGSWWTLSDSGGSVWGSKGSGWQYDDKNKKWSDDNYCHQNKNQPDPGSSTQYIAKAWCFGTLTPAPIAQDGKGKTGSNGPLARGTGFLCNGAPLGNEYQSDGISLDVSFEATQSRDNGSFVCSGGQSSPPATVTLFTDPFSTCQQSKHFDGIDNKWTTTGDVEGDNHGNPHGLVAFLDGKPASSMTTIGINTTGYHTITLTYDDNMDVPKNTTASLIAQYSVDGGSNWTTLSTVTNDHDWISRSWNLSPSADNKSSIKVRFSFSGSSASDHAYIDNVVITGVTP